MVRCEKCGSPIRDGALACEQCGAKARQPYATAGWTPPKEMTAPEQGARVQRLDTSGRQPPAGAEKQVNPFVRNALGFIVLGSFLCSALALGALSSPNFFTLQNWYNILRVFCYQGIIALGAALAARLRGPDLSMGSMMALASVLIAMPVAAGRSALEGIAVAVLVCAVWGLVNGALVSFLRAPAALVTIIVSVLARSLSLSAGEGIPVSISGSGLMGLDGTWLSGAIPAFSLSLLFLCAGIAVLALWFTGRLTGRKAQASVPWKPATMLGYGFVAILSAAAGLVTLASVGAASPATGRDMEVNILFFFAAVQSSRLLDNGLAALGYALAAAFVWTVVNTSMTFLRVAAGFQTIALSAMALALLVVACCARGGYRRIRPGQDRGLFGYEA